MVLLNPVDWHPKLLDFSGIQTDTLELSHEKLLIAPELA